MFVPSKLRALSVHLPLVTFVLSAALLWREFVGISLSEPDLQETVWSVGNEGSSPCFAEGTDPAYIRDVYDRVGEAIDRAVDEAVLSSLNRGTGSDGQRSANYFLTDRWPGVEGSPIELTWSFIQDGVFIPPGFPGDVGGASELFSRMDDLFEGDRALWISIFEGSFFRWASLIGSSYTRVSVAGQDWDDGAAWTEFAGAERGDVRIGMRNVDGPGGALAWNNFPDALSGAGGNMALDSSEAWDSPTSSHLFLRNTIMHEHGHGLGVLHVCPRNSTKLMEPIIISNFLGPQQDDIRAGHRHYGDVFEPDDTFSEATEVGVAEADDFFKYGLELVPLVPFGTTLSLDADGDEDWFHFTTLVPLELTAVATPVGSLYDSSEQSCTSCGASPSCCCSGGFLDSEAIADLAFEIRSGPTGSIVVSTVNDQPPGSAETIANLVLPGSEDYFVRVFEVNMPQGTQLYELELSFALAEVPPFITQQPQDQTVCGGQQTELSITVSSVDPVTYQWKLDAIDLPGVESPSLELNDPTNADEGVYTCVVTNVFGNVVSDPATLTVVTDAECEAAGGDGVFCNGVEVCNLDGVCETDLDPCDGQDCIEQNDTCTIPPGTPAFSVELVEVNGSDAGGAPVNSIVVAPGDLLTVEVFLRDWSPAGQELRVYEFRIDGDGYTSGTIGNIYPQDWLATTDINSCSSGGPPGLANDSNAFIDVASCFEDQGSPPGEPDPVGSDLGSWGVSNPCAVPEDCLTGGSCEFFGIDWVHGGISQANTNPLVDSTACDYVYSEALSGSVGPVGVQDGSKFYAGTVLLRVSDEADGLFTLCLDDTDELEPLGEPDNSFLRDENGQPITPLRFECLDITVFSCSLNDECDDGDVCNGIETCDLLTNQCVTGSAPICDDGLFCNGAEFCDPIDACQDGPAPCPDGNGALCSETLVACVECLGEMDCAAGETCQVEAGVCESLLLMSLETDSSFAVPGSDMLIEVIVDNQTGSNIDLSSYVASLDCSAAAGDAGSIEAVIDAGGLACTGYSEEAICLAVCQDTVPCEEDVLACPSGEACLGDDGQPVAPSTVGLCEGLGSCMPVPSVDESRSDYVFSDAGSTSNNPNGACPTVNVNAANDVPGSSVIPDGQQKYLGTFLYHVSADADGIFQLALLGSSVLVDPLGVELDFTPRSLTLTTGTICDTNLDCEDGDPCTTDLCEANVCDFPPRLYGDANSDDVVNIVDVICSARVIFQAVTTCGGIEISPDEIDIAPSIDCGDGLLNIVDLVIHARAAFQNAIDECCE